MVCPQKLQHRGRTGSSHRALNENSSCAVLLSSQLGEFFKTTVGVRLGCLPSPVLFNLFLETIMQKTLHYHHTPISAGEGPNATYDLPTTSILMAGSNSELQDSTNRLVDRATACEMEVSTEKSKIMTSSTSNISADIC